MPAFSVIIPIHNAEKTLNRCLHSLQNQTDSDFEVLMVENGSNDASVSICQQYVTTDARFHLFVLEDKCGPSIARNKGLQHAQGSWISFVDSDDYVEPGYLDSLHHTFTETNADVVFFGYYQKSLDDRLLGEHIPQISPDADYYTLLTQLYQQDHFGYVWIKAFRRDVIGECRFPPKLNLLEDEIFACEVLSTQRRVAILPQPIYHYITGNNNSLIGRTHPDFCQKVDIAYGAWKKLLQNYEKKEEILTAQANAHVNRCMYYGFERDIDLDPFFHALSQTEFFQNTSLDNRFTNDVKAGHFADLRRMRRRYRLKNCIARLLKK